MLMIAALSISAFATAIISGVIGMAGGVTLLSIMTFFLPWNIIIPVHGVVQLFSNSGRALMLYKNINWSIFRWFIIGIPFGAITSLYLIKQIESKNIPLLLIALLIFYTLFKPKKLPRLSIPIWSFSIVGFLAGVASLLIGATGPLLAVFFLRDDITKKEIVATKAATQTITHIIKIPAFLHLGFNYIENFSLIIPMIICVIGGTKVGVMLLDRINDKMFKLLYQCALLIAGIRILYKVATSL